MVVATVVFSVVYSLGVISVALSNAYFGWELERSESIVWAILFWPFFYLIVLLSWWYDNLEELGEKHRAERAKREKIRVAQVAETARFLEIGEEEAEKMLANSDRKTL